VPPYLRLVRHPLPERSKIQLLLPRGFRCRYPTFEAITAGALLRTGDRCSIRHAAGPSCAQPPGREFEAFDSRFFKTCCRRLER